MNVEILKNIETCPVTERWVNSMISMLRPMIRLVLGRMTGTLFVDLVRRVLVEEAYQHLIEKREGKVTLSELALVTGMDSRVIKQMMNSSCYYTAANLCGEARVLNTWKNDNAYRDKDDGSVKDLLLFGPGQTFQALVTREAGRNVTVQTVLEPLLEKKNVALLGDHKIRLLSDQYANL